MYSFKKIEKFIELRAANLSYEQIASKIKVSRPTLMAWAKKYGSKIDEETKLRLDSLRRTYCVTAQSRITVLGEQLNAIDAEIGKRDLSAVSLEKLLDFKLKYIATLKLDAAPEDPSDTPQAIVAEEKSHWTFSKN